MKFSSLHQYLDFPKLASMLVSHSAFLLLLTFLTCLSFSPTKAQFGLQIPPGKNKVEIPFEYSNGFIIIEVVLENNLPLNFILDTGAEYNILCDKAIADILGLQYLRVFDVLGSDQNEGLKALLVKSEMSLGRMTSKQMDLLAIMDNFFDFQSFTGVPIHGILGAQAFRNHVLQIDYLKEKLTFYRYSHFEPKKGFQPVPIEIYHNKPFIFANYSSSYGTMETLKFLVDTGANIPILVQKDSAKISELPLGAVPGTIARGLGGLLKGYVGKSHALSIEDFGFNGIITNYQYLSTKRFKTIMNNRDGIIGNPLLSRFDLILDLVSEKIYLKPNRKFKDEIKYDKSGLVLISAGHFSGEYIVYEVLPGTPAAQADIRPGDLVKKINGIPGKLSSIGNVISKFQGKEGKKFKILIQRTGESEPQLKTFELRDYLAPKNVAESLDK